MSCEVGRPHHVTVIASDVVVRDMLAGWLAARGFKVAATELPPGGAYESSVGHEDASTIIVLDAGATLAWALVEVERLREAGVWAPTVILCPPGTPASDLADVERRDLAYPVSRPLSIADFERAFARALRPAQYIEEICRHAREGIATPTPAKVAPRRPKVGTAHGNGIIFREVS